MPSNNLIIKGSPVPLPASLLEVGCTCTNYVDDGEIYLGARTRKRPLEHFVIHETAGNTANGCKQTLHNRFLGVHLILDRDGRLSNHADLETDVCWHAGQLNNSSIGIEVVNPYAPSLAKIEYDAITAPWWCWCPNKEDRRYVLPTTTQQRIVSRLIPWLCGQLKILYVFPTKDLSLSKQRINKWFLRTKPEAGIVAHRDFSSHSDGRFLLELLIYGE